MSGVIHRLPLYAFMAWTETILMLTFFFYDLREDKRALPYPGNWLAPVQKCFTYNRGCTSNILLFIRKVSGSIHDANIGSPIIFSVILLGILRQAPGLYLKLEPRTSPPTSYTVHYS